MEKKRILRPDEAAMLRLLAKYVNRVEEIIFRLAWQAGLTRQEIVDLKWSDISFEERMIHLPRRSVPMVDEIFVCLDARRVQTAEKRPASPYVVITDGYAKHPTKVHLSRLVAAAIDEEESLRGIRLDDLRNDFIIRVLEKNPTTYAMEVAGINRVPINATFADYLPGSKTKEKNKRRYYEQIDEKRLKALIDAEGSSEVAITLQLGWELGLPLMEIVSLTWDQVDFEKKELQIGESVYALSATLIQILQEAYSNSISSEEPHILLTPRSKQPFARDRLSKVVRNALIRGGLEEIQFTRLSHVSLKKARLEKIYSYIKGHGYINTKQVAALWGVSVKIAQQYLYEVTEQGLLVRKGDTRSGVKYYLPKNDIM